MRVLVACEESQRVCIAFRECGHEAYSCDILEPSGGHPEWHIQGDVARVVNGRCSFLTMDGCLHFISGTWDLLIAFPPCTYLSRAGACRLYPRAGHIDYDRLALGFCAKSFFLSFLNADCPCICVENPVPLRVFDLPKHTQVIQPYEFGHPYSKKTYLWLRGLPKLVPTNVLSDFVPYISSFTSRNKGNKLKSGFSRSGGAALTRSKTFEGIAKAMAEQWSFL